MTAVGGVTDMAALNDLLDAYLVPPASRATILEAVTAVQADGIPVVGRTSPAGGHVSLAPADAVVAAYVHPNRLSLALDARVAARAVAEHEFCRIEEDAAIGGRVHLVMEQWAVQQHAIVVRGLIIAALRAAAPRSAPARGARRIPAARPTEATTRAKPAVCPIHFVQLVNGHCDFCD